MDSRLFKINRFRKKVFPMRKTIEFGVRELVDLKIACKKCSAVVGSPTGQLSGLLPDGKCIACGELLFDPNHNPFTAIAKAITDIGVGGWNAELILSIPAEYSE